MAGGLFDMLKNLIPNQGTSLFGGPPASPLGADGMSAIPSGPLSAENNGGLLHAGDDDMRPAPGMAPPVGAGLLRATEPGMPLPPPVGLMSAAGPTPPTDVTPGGLSGGPGLHPPTAPPDATIRAPYETKAPVPAQAGISMPVPGAPAGAAGGSAAPPAPPPAPGSGAAAGGAAPGGAQQSALGKLADMGKALGAAGGQGATAGTGHGISGMGGDPAAASRAGAADLLAKVMAANQPMKAGPTPQVPGLLQQRFRR